MESSAFFLGTTLVMSALAASFIAIPLRNKRAGLAGISTALPLFAAGLYLYVGSPQAASLDKPGHSLSRVDPGASAANRKPIASVASMVDGLAIRLAENPDDAKGWLLLARSYKHLDRIPEARSAYDTAAVLGEYDAELAELSVSSSSGKQSAPNISGSLQLSERSRQIVMPTDTVFIFARAVDGPPMPVAVLQRPVSDLPMEFILNDSLSMTASSKLSNFEQVTVTARISRSGVASDALKGLEARSEFITVADNRHLDLIIE